MRLILIFSLFFLHPDQVTWPIVLFAMNALKIGKKHQFGIKRM